MRFAACSFQRSHVVDQVLQRLLHGGHCTHGAVHLLMDALHLAAEGASSFAMKPVSTDSSIPVTA